MPEKSKLTPREAKKMIKAKLGKNFCCPRCLSKRIKYIIEPNYITDTTITVELKCKKCSWATMNTLNIVYK